MSAAEFGRQLVDALAGQEVQPDRQMSEDLTSLHRRIAELLESETFLLADNERTLADAAEGWAAAERYRLAWMSARQRARDVIRHWTAVTTVIGWQRDRALTERDEALKLRNHHHGMYEQARDLAARYAGERNEARVRANEAARLSAEARDRNDDQDKVIADLREQVSIVDSDRLTYDAWALNVLTEHGLTYDIADLRTPIADYLRALTAERDRLGEHAQHLVNRCAEFRTERDEARAELVKLGKEGEERRRTIRLLQNRIQEANGITPAIAEVFGCPTCRTILNAEAAGGCKDEWHHANRQTAATDRLRAALDEVRIEPEEISEERIQRVIAAAGLGEERIEPESSTPRCDAVGPTGALCWRPRGSHATHQASTGDGGSISWPAERIELPHARFHAFVASGYDPSLCRCGGTRGEHLGGRTEGEAG